MMENDVRANNEFVRKQQNEMRKKMGDKPKLSSDKTKFDAYMCNNGKHAQEFARELTKGIDHSAFPVK